MATLANDRTQDIIKGGKYVFKTSGALDIQMQIDNEGFATIPDGVIAGATTGQVIDLPSCTLKVVNGSTFALTFARVE